MNSSSPAICRGGGWVVLTGAIVVMSVAMMGLFGDPAGADDWKEFYQFRHSSSLPGNLFGVSPQGQVGFSGALQQNVPVAYTPTKDNWVIGGNSGSNTSNFEIGWGGAGVNGTAFLGIGWGSSGRGRYSSFMATGSDLCEAYNFQFQLAPGDEDRWAFAVGVQDILNQREDRVGDPHGARSFYGVATKPITDPFKGYLTLGWGDGRFDNSPFAGLSIPLDNTLTLVTEYDGCHTNAGLAISGLGQDSEGEDWIALGYIGYSDLDRPVIGFTLTKH